ncbi:MAG: LysR family transcriptional regulator [Synergistaceae bacterium]|nr:LysR family transcriptional regulator [Synergistaceae bacterium]
MRTESLKTFITLAHSGNFTKTAQELLVVQSTVSSRIKELESEIGQKLFDRNKNNVTLTAAGEMFLRTAMEIVAMEESAVAKINMSVKYADNLTVACTHTLFDCYILDDSIKFMRENPDISLKLNIAHSSEIIANLGSYNLDVAYTYYPFHHARYICSPFVTEQFILVTNSSNRAYLHGIARNELLDVPIIFSDLTSGNNVEGLIPQQRIYPLDVNIISRIIPFLKGGNWYCFLPVSLVKKDIEEGSLIEIPLKGMQLHKHQSYVIYKRYYKKSTGLSRWIESNILKKTWD